MRSTCEQKEDLRLRMADLEKKLAESEDERLKLEKTCNVLMRAFREEEKMHYKALNKKYEKFLEDCSMRRRRNEIILRSLCRIEDRSRALFAKTERLKLLKDRYISYLKVNQFKRDEVSSDWWKNFSVASPNNGDGVITKSVQWNTPLALGFSQRRFSEVRGDVISGNDRLTAGSLVVDKFDAEKRTGFLEFGSGSKWNRTGTEFNYPIAVETKREELVRDRSRVMREVTRNENWEEVRASMGTEGGGHPGSIEKLRKSLSVVDYPECEWSDPNSRILLEKAIKPSELDPVEARNKSFNEFPITNHHVVTSSTKSSVDEEGYDVRNKDSELEEENSPKETLSKPEKNLPLGLDGVDYQNETYPESYYEQPVHHHNNLSIASDVILEEDETEEDVEEEENEVSRARILQEPRESSADGEDGNGVKTWEEAKSPKRHSTVVERDSTCISSKERESYANGYPKNADVGVSDDVKSRESDSEKGSGEKRSESHSEGHRGNGSEREVEDMSQENKVAPRTNLLHLLESDSESFQIEHGGRISGNDDSDFDFSFSKN